VQFDLRNGSIRKKYDSLKYTLRKMENTLYELSLAEAGFKRQEDADAVHSKHCIICSSTQGCCIGYREVIIAMIESRHACERCICPRHKKWSGSHGAHDSAVKQAADGKKVVHANILPSH